MIYFKDFEIRPTAYLDGHTELGKYDVVKWCKRDKPIEVLNLATGKKEMSDKFCYSIAHIWYNKKEPCWEFKSIGTRFLEDYTDGLSEFILKFIELLDVRTRLEEDGEYD